MPNRLARSTSPYLLQHKDNPVDWWEWGDEAFSEARERDVPVLLSVGYSSCHWCHVMAHESFEDPETAAEMNRLHVNVKVDREERPDVDSVYMEAVQAMTGQGGWPMTVWLTPDGRPFYAGTYFPDEDRHGMPSFRKVMRAVAEAWSNRREEVQGQSLRLTEAISSSIPSADELPGTETLRAAYRSIEQAYDAVNGGFGKPPKFPQAPVLDFLLRVHRESWAPRSAEMLRVTLEEMALGGIHDQLGGGFARYAVDEQWLVPHFEKMLYDNAQLARVYLWAGIELEDASFLDVARSTLRYLTTYLRHPQGGFFSAEDADSEGVEGKFYLWTIDELSTAIGETAAEEAARFFGVTSQGNFEGSNILHRPTSDPWSPTLDEMRARLLQHRDTRVRPELDDKVVTSWNGLAVTAFAEAGSVLQEGPYLDVARTTARFVLDEMVVGDRLHRSWRDGEIGAVGFLEDHASMARGLLTLYQATGEQEWLNAARELMDQVHLRFADPLGGFFDTSIDSETLIKRPKSHLDNPLPSGNGMAAEALFLLHAYTADPAIRESATATLRSAGLLMENYPSMVAHHLSVLHAMENGRELAIVGPDWQSLARAHWERYRPEVVLAGSETGSEPLPLFEGRQPRGETLAYLCRGHVCDLPAPDLYHLRAQLSLPSTPPSE